MSKILLDTSAYSGFMKGHPGLKAALQEADAIFINPVVLGELHAGFIRGRHRIKNDKELRLFLSSSRVNPTIIDQETAQCYAVILDFLWKSGSPIPTNDIWIAATAMQYGLRLLTTDTHFQKVPQVIVDFFNA